MKTKCTMLCVVSVFCLFCSTTIHAQNFLNPYGGYDYGSFVTIRPDGYPIVGVSNYYMSKLEGTDNDGDALWSREFEGRANELFVNDDNTMLFFYSTEDEFILEKLSESGETMWSVPYTFAALGIEDYDDSLVNNKLTRNDDDEYSVLHASYDYLGCSGMKFNINRFDNAGLNITSFNFCQEEYLIPGAEWLEFNSIVSATDHVTITGTMYGDSPDYIQYLNIVNFDESGTLISQKVYEGYHTSGSIQMEDGYIIYGWYQEEASLLYHNYEGYYFMKTDFFGDSLWVQRYPGTEVIEHPISVDVTPAGNIVSLMRNTFDDFEMDIIKHNTAGEVVWTAGTGIDNYWSEGEAIDFNAINDNRFALTSPKDIEFSNFAILMVTDSTGEYPVVEISGTVFYDENDNGIMDVDELGVSDQMITTSAEDITVFTDHYGNYTTEVYEDETIEILLTPEAEFYQSVPTGGGPQIVEPDLSSGYYLADNVDFALQFVTEGENVSVEILPSGIAPGFDTHCYVHVENKGSESIEEGTISLTHPEELTLTETYPAYASYADNIITWNYSDLVVFDLQSVHAYFTADETTEVGIDLQYTAITEPLATDINTIDNYDTIEITTVSSLDPNHKLVFPNGEGEDGLIDATTSTLEYQIDFQNTGTAEAHFIIIRDTLDHNLDAQSIQMLAASHNYVLEIEGTNILKWIFNDIFLPDSTSDPAGSMGQLKFKINIKDGTEVGTTIKNAAAIYFDYNPPVITNTTRSTLTIFEYIPGAADEMEIVLFPNPASEMLFIQFPYPFQKDVVYTISDVTGKIITGETITKDNPSQIVDISALAKGIYQFNIIEAGQILSSRQFEIVR